MICPNCQREIPDTSTLCPFCGEPIPEDYLRRFASRSTLAQVWRYRHRWAISAVILFFVTLAMLTAAIMIYYFVRDFRIHRDYERGPLTPEVSEIMLSDDRPAHSILFFGDDGDSIFIPELRTTYPISGGVARVAVPDGMWFDDNSIEETENAIVTLSPMLMRHGAEGVRLPQITMDIAVPSSPLTVTSPASDNTVVYTTLMPLTFKVVPGSQVLINGTDASDQVDRNGDITYNVNIYPIGDNTFSILVKTPNHRETRRDVTFYREEMDIEVSLSSYTSYTSATDTMRVTGVTEPDSMIVVDSSHVENSVEVNHSTGEFSFIASFNTIGDNTVRFHAEREGSPNSNISFVVNYVPTLDAYSRKAWAMDYEGLTQMYEQWTGRIFLCEGVVTDVYFEQEEQFVAMNVAGEDEEEQIVILQNESGVGAPERGRRFKAYADVAGRVMYNAAYCPQLVCRYMLPDDD